MANLRKGGIIMLQNLTIKAFADELASSSPAPGGGSAAALAASLGSALGSMVFNLTVGKKVYNEYDEEKKEQILNSLKETNSSKDEFLSLMERDAEEFLQLMSAFKLPKETETEKLAREEKINAGYIKALEVPFIVAKKSFDMYSYIETAARYGNKNAVSDAGVAALLLQAAIESAVLNVRINLPSLKDEIQKKQIQEECSELVKKGALAKDSILNIVNLKL
jgi:formiminotetrahydrofolate cyclodeaminase